MKQPTQRRRMVKPSRKFLPIFLSILWVLLLSWSNAFSQTQGVPAPVSTTAQESTGPVPSPPEAPAPPPSGGITAAAEQIKEALTKESFAYVPLNMLDPFVPFIAPADSVPQTREIEAEEEDLSPEHKKPLTPLQRMSVAEIEKGLKAITWGELGRKAIIEDAAGKGYIVSVGTPAGDKNGMITEIFNDRLVIQQEVWDKDARRMVPQNSIVKLKKEVKQQ